MNAGVELEACVLGTEEGLAERGGSPVCIDSFLHTWLAGIVEAPVDAVCPRMGIDYRGKEGQSGRGNDRGADEHFWGCVCGVKR